MQRLVNDLFALVLLAVAAMLPVGSFAAQESGSRPNVLFIAIDDLRPELGCYGANHIQSANIDKLAARGVQFDRAYCQFPVCGPSRASLLSGLYATRTRFKDNSALVEREVADALTLPGAFRRAGYYTVGNGKIYHHADDMAGHSWSEPPVSLVNGPIDNNHLTFHDKDSANYIGGKRNRGPFFEAPDVPDNTYIDGQTCEKTIKDLRRLAEMDRPFFLACGFVRPHLPFYAPKKYWDLYDRDAIELAENRYLPKDAPPSLRDSGEVQSYHDRGIEYNSMEFHKIARHGYYACVSYADSLVGRLLATLDELGLRDNTIVVLWGDHGWHLGEHNFWSKNNLLHNAMRSPLIIHAPGFKKNVKTDGIVELVDIYPTLCELAGIELPNHLQGTSMVPIMRDPARPGKHAAFTRDTRGAAVTTRDYVYAEYGKDERMLFDHRNDPDENVNVAGNREYRETVERLSKLLAIYCKIGENGNGEERGSGAFCAKHRAPTQSVGRGRWGQKAPDPLFTRASIGEVIIESSLTDHELVTIRDGFSARKSSMLSLLANKPFVSAAKRPPLKPGRARYVRHYSYSVTDFAMKAFLLNEQLDEANRALQEYGRFYLDNPAERDDRDNFYWPADVVCRMVEFFGSRGSRAPGRLTQQTEDILLEMAWIYSKETSKIADAETVMSKTWHVHESENHHLQRFSTVWHFSKLLGSDDRYARRPYDDGKTALEHYHAWTQYALEYLRERARKGLFVEIASKGYGLQSIKCVYSFYDFSEDPSLKRTAGKFLDLFWATWAEEQIDSVRGGGKTRVYQGLNSQAQSYDSINRLAWYYLGQGNGAPPRGNEFSIITSDYRLPLVVMDIALDTQGRGNYEITQRRMGLAQDGYYTPPGYRLRTDFGGILRYSYCTPDFIVGTLMCEARPLEDWTMISSQNRWHGVIFRGHANARLYVQCRADKVEKTYNQQWSVQRKGTLITQKLAGEKYSRGPDQLRVWFANLGLNNRREKGRWVFVEAPDAYAAVCPVAGGYQWVKASGRVDGDWLCCENSLTPVIVEVASKSQFADYRSFQEEILASELQFDSQKLAYTGLGGDRFTFYADYSQVPEINGQAIDYAPEQVFNSPFIQSVWNSGIVTIRKDQRERTLDFNPPSSTK